MTDIFEQVRRIPAHEAAQKLGIDLRRRGSRYWTCCPLHGERTESLCFYPDGRFYCFGCHAGGSTVDLYLRVLGLSTPLEAAQRATADFGLTGEAIAPDTVSEYRRRAEVTRQLEQERRREENQLCAVKHLAADIAASKDALTAWDDPEFLTAMDALCYAQDRLSQTLTYGTNDYAAERLEEARAHVEPARA